jgi:AAA15 family ATPase/GTPase
MRITNLKIENFKRFTDLSIEQIPESAKLVLLVGSNGSGKSSVFDAFDWLKKDLYTI